MKTEKIKIVSDWDDLLLGCPSQCYLKMLFEGRFFLLYLRWRWADLWAATLVECDSDYYMHNPKYEWADLEVEFWKENQLTEIKENAIQEAKKYIYKRL